ncbi:tRNA (N6-threonylcarbamoyladenosine(37)-N6)-methyltransferase TrmO [Desulforhopalus vacuolatus]|uniref:tRNA (N6-threonylcarbamoyladenosine(37)-N6)-methyltransferase TrmO n=1 Tax=Desulforhopalus vacuolatus TaxID=40414 RepID=UPI001964F296|nr:tRNA (N6-threonylcarbamoyladenosine(37)-N6)-methyltransferase TrmO [Desulforhopalus vacuolatus]MBM9519823.1 tRNA (N6-threonylcarbamoyladenosine(37)-N6)-methyltransferase TrmO [Desulforhopalus vacuolatus]
MADEIIIKPVGYIRSKYTRRAGTPFQGRESTGSCGTIEILPEFKDGIQDLKVGMKITVIFNFHLSTGYTLITLARNSSVPRGVFSTRSPDRPNSLGITTVEIVRTAEGRIDFLGADMLDGTPVIDIKPGFES